MWFVAHHSATPGSEDVISLDFKNCMATLADDKLEDEFQELRFDDFDTDSRNITPTTVVASSSPTFMPLKSVPWLPVMAFPSPPASIPPPPPSPTFRPSTPPRDLPPPPPSPLPRRASEDLGVDSPPVPLLITPTGRRQHTLLTDAVLLKWVEIHGPTWRELARALGGRANGWSDDIVRNRYVRIFEAACGLAYERRPRTPEYKRPDVATERWTEQEDQLLVKLLREAPLGQRPGAFPWKTIRKNFAGNRTQQAIRNRASRLGLRGDVQ